jgi:hypothetical protein
MIPSVLSSQVQKGVEDFLNTTFLFSTPFFHGKVCSSAERLTLQVCHH